MKRHIFIIGFIAISIIKGMTQVAQFPQVYYNGQGGGGTPLNVRQSAGLSATAITSLSTTSKIGAVAEASSTESYGKATWAKVCLPSQSGSATATTVRYGYMMYGQSYIRINPTNNYATVNTQSLNIRPCAGCTGSNITLSGVNAVFGQNTIVALTGNSSGGWYEVYLTNDCSQTTGWLSGSFLTINSNTQNYYNVGGAVTNSSGPLIWGATINIGSWTTNSTEGFYQYKTPQNWSGTITCSHPSYNSSTPSSYSYNASSHSYTRSFVLGNTVSCTAVTKGPTQPENQIKDIGSTATFNVSVNGTAPFSYFWYKNGNFVKNTLNTNSTTDAYTTPTLTSSDDGNTYYCLIQNCNNQSQVQSTTATLKVNSNCTNSTDPTSLTASKSTIASGESVTLTVNGGLLGSCASWKWYTGNSCGGTLLGTTTAKTFNVTPSSPSTTYSVRAEGGNTTACQNTTVTVVATNNPITGKVYDYSGQNANPLLFSGASVKLRNSIGNTLESTITNSSGDFQFSNLTESNYQVHVTKGDAEHEIAATMTGINPGTNLPITKLPYTLRDQTLAANNALKSYTFDFTLGYIATVPFNQTAFNTSNASNYLQNNLKVFNTQVDKRIEALQRMLTLYRTLNTINENGADMIQHTSEEIINGVTMCLSMGKLIKKYNALLNTKDLNAIKSRSIKILIEVLRTFIYTVRSTLESSIQFIGPKELQPVFRNVISGSFSLLDDYLEGYDQGSFEEQIFENLINEIASSLVTVLFYKQYFIGSIQGNLDLATSTMGSLGFANSTTNTIEKLNQIQTNSGEAHLKYSKDLAYFSGLAEGLSLGTRLFTLLRSAAVNPLALTATTVSAVLLGIGTYVSEVKALTSGAKGIKSQLDLANSACDVARQFGFNENGYQMFIDRPLSDSLHLLFIKLDSLKLNMEQKDYSDETVVSYMDTDANINRKIDSLMKRLNNQFAVIGDSASIDTFYHYLSTANTNISLRSNLNWLVGAKIGGDTDPKLNDSLTYYLSAIKANNIIADSVLHIGFLQSENKATPSYFTFEDVITPDILDTAKAYPISVIVRLHSDKSINGKIIITKDLDTLLNIERTFSPFVNDTIVFSINSGLQDTSLQLLANISSDYAIGSSRGIVVRTQSKELLISLNGKTELCASDSTMLIANPPQGCIVFWKELNLGAIVGTGDSLIIHSGFPGQFSAIYNDTTTSKTFYSKNSIEILNPRIDPVMVVGSSVYCNNVTLTASGGSGGKIYWQGTKSEGTDTTQAITSKQVSASGTYYFRAFNGNCWGPEGSAEVTINAVPNSVSVSGGGTFCGNTALTASGASGDIIYWQATTSNGTSRATPSTHQNVTSSGTYYFRAYNESCGWGSQGSATVTINEIFSTSASIAITSGTNPTCAGQPISFTAIPTNGGTSPTYTWKVDGDNTGNNNPTYATIGLTDGQIVTCEMTSNLDCASPVTVTSNGISMAVNPISIANWIGTADDSWHNPLNWNCGMVPNEAIDVVVKSGTPFNCIIYDDAICKSLTASKDVIISVQPNRHLYILSNSGGITLPIITTTTITDITFNTANTGGNIISDGGSSITGRGVCYSLNSSPTFYDNNVPSGADIGMFVTPILGLEASKMYYVRAYATTATDTSYGNEISFSTKTEPLKIGQTFAGGTIFYIDGTGEQGLVCAPTDQGIINGGNTNYYVHWGCQGVDVAGTSKALGSGPQNTAAIVAACGENNTAAKICNDLLLNGFDDWYLPTEDELTMISQNLTPLGLFNSTSNCIDHWSSSQYSASDAYTTFVVGCNNNPPILNYHRSKGANALVRAVRAFKATTASVPILGTKPGIVTSSTSANSGGYISSDGGSPVTARGICWAVNPQPTRGDNYTLDGIGIGSFNSTMIGLNGCGTQYYVRAYATNNIGTAYGNEIIVSSGFYASLPALNGISEITYNSAVAGGLIENNGGCNITARGVCWSIAPNPTTNSSKTIDGLGIGSFVSNLTNLGSNVKYYVRAYATNAIGTVYSEQDSFVTTAPTGLYIGENYAGGIIFFLDNTGEHGLVCAPTDQGITNGTNTNYYVRWGCEGVDVAGTSKALGSGPQNTASIVAACGENNTAAKICNDLVLNGFDDWYLPTEDELTMISQNLTPLGVFISKSNCIDHWSSSQYSVSDAYTTFVSSCNNNPPILNYHRSKGANALVRAVRAF